MPTEETAQLTPAECEVAANRLSALAADLQDIARKNCEIWVFRKPSLSIAIERAESFHRELLRSVEAIKVGDPYGPNTEKGRKSVKSRSQDTAKKKRKKAAPKVPGVTTGDQIAEVEPAGSEQTTVGRNRKAPRKRKPASQPESSKGKKTG